MLSLKMATSLFFLVVKPVTVSRKLCIRPTATNTLAGHGGHYIQVSRWPERSEKMPKYNVICYVRVDPDPESVGPLSHEEALRELEQAQMMSPNDIFKIEEI